VDARIWLSIRRSRAVLGTWSCGREPWRLTHSDDLSGWQKCVPIAFFQSFQFVAMPMGSCPRIAISYLGFFFASRHLRIHAFPRKNRMELGSFLHLRRGVWALSSRLPSPLALV